MSGTKRKSRRGPGHVARELRAMVLVLDQRSAEPFGPERDLSAACESMLRTLVTAEPKYIQYAEPKEDPDMPGWIPLVGAATPAKLSPSQLPIAAAYRRAALALAGVMDEPKQWHKYRAAVVQSIEVLGGAKPARIAKTKRTSGTKKVRDYTAKEKEAAIMVNKFKGNKSAAAKAIGIDESTLRERLDRAAEKARKLSPQGRRMSRLPSETRGTDRD